MIATAVGGRQEDGRSDRTAVDAILPVVAICAGVAIVVGNDYLVRGGEQTQAAWTRQPADSGRPRARRAYSRTITLLCGAAFIVVGALDLAGVTSLSGSRGISVGPGVVTGFLVVFGLAALAMVVQYLRRRR